MLRGLGYDRCCSDSLMKQPDSTDNSTAIRTFTFMLDGIGDPRVARGITFDLKEKLGLVSRCDPAGMWLEVESGGAAVIDEAFADRVIEVARHWGLEPRDRVGSSFVATISEAQLRKRLVSEWRTRFATALVFLLPAMLIYYLRPMLAGATNYVPNGIVAVLVGWTIVAAGWPIVYQGFVSAVSFRMTPDLFGATLILVSFGVGVWETVRDVGDTTLNVTALAVLALAFQRKRVWENAARTAGQGHLMLPAGRFLLALWLGSIVVGILDFGGGLAMMLAVPPLIGMLTINRLTHPVLWVIPITLFALVVGLGRLVLPTELEHLSLARVESAFGFVMLVTFVCCRFAPVGDDVEGVEGLGSDDE